MAWTLVASTKAGSGSGSGTTTSAINCVGADLIVAEVNSFALGTFSDSAGNTWSQIGPFTTTNIKSSIYYRFGPAVQSSQTFSYLGSNIFAGLAITAWSGSVGGNGSADQTNHATAFAFTAASATIGAGGTAYVVNDVLTVSGGTFTTAAKFTVTAVSSGAVTAVALQTAGAYTATPANPAATTGGTGSGCTLNVTYNSDTSLATGSITPTNNNSLIIAGLATDQAVGSLAISVGTIQQNLVWTNGLTGAAIASFVQSTAAPINPSWSWTTAADAAAIVVSFPPALPSSYVGPPFTGVGVGPWI